ncbi:hypothetical protein STCU_09077 [Strigomonas culicis]|uniref:Uncharacterized protein n=1 Tax=Strigomonas culicis TaxID=28005 RepID=S9VB12_9TRYP|nr:hypothetical protein STCU_09077 [Strigomonas culicis]|eukprot:EPY20265.1 hypothetical protein STCU_09077 [Strigomonas culicis]
MTVILTNTSKKFTSFRVLPISPAHSGILSVQYELPKRISAGLSWPITVHFKPTTARDVDAKVNIKIEEGYFSIPVKLRKKRTVVTVEPATLDFGTLTIGQTNHQSIKLRNDGASPTTIIISGSFKKLFDTLHTNPITNVQEPFFTIKPILYQIDLEPHSEKMFDVTFAPNEETDFSCDITFTERQDNTEKNFTVVIRGKATSSPVFVSSSDLDFRWCFYGETYSDEVEILNNSNVTANVEPLIPRKLKKTIFFEPPNACIQPKSSYKFKVLFCPLIDSVAEDFLLKLNIGVKGQALPATLHIKANVTPRAPQLSKSTIRCGETYVNVERIEKIKIRNMSKLPQMLGFLSTPANIKTRPSVFTLIGEEEMEVEVGIIAPRVGTYVQEIYLSNEYGDRQSLLIEGTGLTPELFFSESTIYMPTCPVGVSVTASTVMTNTTGESLEFQFQTTCPHVIVSPTFGTIRPKETLAVTLFLNAPSEKPPPPAVADPPSPVTGKRRPGRASKTSRVQAHDAPPPAAAQGQNPYEDWAVMDEAVVPWGRQKTVALRCGVKGHSALAFLLDVHCAVARPNLVGSVLLPAAPAAVEAKSTAKTAKKAKDVAPPPTVDTITITPFHSVVEIDFGEISIFHRETRTCLLRNDSDEPVRLQLQPWNALSPFAVLHFPHGVLQPRQEAGVVLQFRPLAYGEFRDVFGVFAGGTSEVQLRVRGSCCLTDLLITTEDMADVPYEDDEAMSEVVFEPILAGEVATQSVYFHNLGSFPLQVRLELAVPTAAAPEEGGAAPHGPPNMELLAKTFLFHPARFDVAPRTRVASQVLFRPRAEGLAVAILKVKAGGFEERLRVSGRGCGRSIYAVFPAVDQQASKLHLPHVGTVYEYPLRFRFARGESKTIVLGSVKGGPTAECVVERWNDYYGAIGWQVGPMRWTVPPGAPTRLVLTLQTAQAAQREVFIPFCRFALTVKCNSDPSNDRTYYISCTGAS